MLIKVLRSSYRHVRDLRSACVGIDYDASVGSGVTPAQVRTRDITASDDLISPTAISEIVSCIMTPLYFGLGHYAGYSDVLITLRLRVPVRHTVRALSGVRSPVDWDWIWGSGEGIPVFTCFRIDCSIVSGATA